MIVIDLNEIAEERLKASAGASGVPVERYAKELLENLLVPTEYERNLDEAAASSDVEPFPVLEGYVPTLSKDELY